MPASRPQGALFQQSRSWMNDGDAWIFGAGKDMLTLWSVKDANANCGVIDLPDGDAVNVPVLAVGVDIWNRDLGFFNGKTQPLIAVVDADWDSWVGIGFSADDKAYLTKGGSAWMALDLGGTIPAAAAHNAGIDGVSAVYNDLGTLITGQTYRSGYFRYNAKPTVAGNPTSEITGVEGVAASYNTDEGYTLRGGYFRTYIDTDTEALATARTSVGCEISARASYAGGTEVTADAGTGFIGARIWMAPYFTDGTFANLTNSHGLWIINETPNGGSWSKYVENAIKIDATTYGSAFNYNFNADTGKFYVRLNGAVAGSGVVDGERSAAAGDDWMTYLVDDYRTLVTGQTYRTSLFRYNIRSTTPGNPASEVTGVEGVVALYAPDEALTARGGHFRFYIDTDADPLSTLRTGIGAEISARASYVGGVEVAAEAGTAFVGSRIWMAPYFSAVTVDNVNNFWGVWIYGEHATQRNADAAIFVSDAGGGFTDYLRFTPAADGDVNIVKIGVTGDPVFFWDESEDAFAFNKSLAMSVDGLAISAFNQDDAVLLLNARDNGAGLVSVARLIGAADPYFEATLPMVFAASAMHGTLVQGHQWFDADAVRGLYYDGTKVRSIPYIKTVASDTLQHSNDTERTTVELAYTKIKEIELEEEHASVRIKFDLKTAGGGATATARIYKNDGAVGTEQTDVTGGYVTKSEDLTGFIKGDLLQIWAKTSDAVQAAYVNNFRLYYDEAIDGTAMAATNQDPV